MDTPSEQQGRISATSATRELDELMACLSDFKVQSNVSVCVYVCVCNMKWLYKDSVSELKRRCVWECVLNYVVWVIYFKDLLLDNLGYVSQKH